MNDIYYAENKTYNFYRLSCDVEEAIEQLRYFHIHEIYGHIFILGIGNEFNNLHQNNWDEFIELVRSLYARHWKGNEICHKLGLKDTPKN